LYAKILLRRAERCCRHIDVVDAVALERPASALITATGGAGGAAFATALYAERITGGRIERDAFPEPSVD
jgi:hypothetical protein